MIFSFSRTTTVLTLALAAGCAAAASDGSASADETPAESTTAAIATPAATTITPTQFVALFGQAGPVTGTATIDCGIGEIRLFAGPMPTNFLPADGRLLPIDENQAIFAELGTTFGGNGTTTFAIPNLKAVTPNHLAYGMCVSGTFTGNRE